ncbi:MAG: HlyD family efflux transporter periplasmic adaptor subunit [Chloroflexota bacterium]
MNWKRMIITIVVLAGLVGAGYWAYGEYLAPQPAPAVSTQTDQTNTLSVPTNRGRVSAEGVIEPLQYAALAFQSGGEVAEILVREGAVVESGTPLIRLDMADLDVAVTQAEARLVQAQANLAAANAGRLALAAALETAEIGIEAAQVQLDLVTSTPLTTEIAILQSQVAVANAQITQATGSRDLALEGPTSAQIQAAEAELAAAVAARRPLQEAYSQLVRLEITGDARDRLQTQLNAAEARVNAAQARLDELRAGVPAGQRQAAVAGVAVAGAQRDVVQAELDLFLAGSKPEQIALAEIGVSQAEAARDEAALAVTQAETAVAQAAAAVTQAELALTSVQTARDRQTLTAPFSGRIGRLDIEVGEIAAPGLPLLTLADLSGWLVKTSDLTELDVVALTSGHPATVRVDAVPNETIAGTITDIALIAGLTRGDVVYEVTISLDESQAAQLPLRWGMTVVVEIDVD